MHTYNRTASSTTYLDFLRQAQEGFFSAVAKEVNTKQHHVKAKVGRTGSTGFLEFEGTDANDLALSGWAMLSDRASFEAAVLVQADSAYRGKLETTVHQKVGNLSVDLVVNVILDWVGLQP